MAPTNFSFSQDREITFGNNVSDQEMIAVSAVNVALKAQRNV